MLADLFRSSDMPKQKPSTERSEKWRAKAKCKGMSPEDTNRIFYPESSPSTYYDNFKEAEWWCKKCPVQKECLIDAIEHERRDPFGYRGGMNDQQRLALYKELKRAKKIPTKVRIQPTKRGN